MLHGVVFTDFGTASEVEVKARTSGCAGLRLRITIPAMGPAPIALDFASRFTARDRRQQIFSFNIASTGSRRLFLS